jgi:predicted dinucleotide-binding enzyme
MNIGIIGSGNIGAELARKLSAAGHMVKLANSRGPDTLKDIVDGTSISAVAKEDVATDADVVILSIPFARNAEAAALLANAPANAIFVDTSNYYPQRDGRIAEVESGKPETVWASEQVGRPLIKAWNAILSQTLIEAGAAPGTPGRIAIPFAGDDLAAKHVVAELVSATGFDTVDAGDLAGSWRFQPGSPAYCTELTIQELEAALSNANRDRSPSNRDAIMKAISDGTVAMTRAAMAANNRLMSN